MTVAAEKLRQIISSIERLEGDKAEIAADIKEVYAGAKADGFDTKILRAVIRLRKLSKDERAEMESLIDTYMANLEGGSDE
jgi:uncharacterized protein (UPF0335 family)